MKITFLGVGEACDERYPNTSLLIRGMDPGGPGGLLLDCGFTVPPLVWPWLSSPDELAGVWLSHFHGDHFFGLPALLLRLWETGRTRRLAIVGQQGIGDLVDRTMDLAYPGFRKRLGFALEFSQAEPGESLNVLGYEWRTAVSEHGQRCLAVRLDGPGGSIFYSGDGRPTAATLELAKGCRLLVHEAFALNSEMLAGHGTVAGCIEFARAAGAEFLAVVHVQREVRRDRFERARAMLDAAAEVDAFAPEPGDQLIL